MGIPAYNANFDVQVTPSFVLGGQATAAWSNPTTQPDHWRVYNQSVPPALSVSTPAWSGSIDISGPLPGATRSFSFNIPNDGSANFVWVVGWDAGETTANKIFPVQYSAANFSESNTTTMQANGVQTGIITNPNIPWSLNSQVGGTFQGQSTWSIVYVSGTTNITFPIAAALEVDYSESSNFALKTNVVTDAPPPSGSFAALPFNRTSTLQSNNNTNGNGVIRISPPGVYNSPMNYSEGCNLSGTINIGDTLTLQLNFQLTANYISPVAFNTSGGAGAGQGGGGNLAPSPPVSGMGSIPLTGLANGGGELSGNTQCLPCIPCCQTVLGQPSPTLEARYEA